MFWNYLHEQNQKLSFRVQFDHFFMEKTRIHLVAKFFRTFCTICYTIEEIWPITKCLRHFVIGHQNGFDQRKYCSTSLHIVHRVGEYTHWGSWLIVQILKLVLYNTRSNPVLNTLKLFFNTCKRLS